MYLEDENPANLDFKTVDIDLGIFSWKNFKLERNDVDMEIET